jgi:hypothetical protein
VELALPTHLERSLSLTSAPVAASVRCEVECNQQNAYAATFALPSCFGSSEFDAPLLKLVDVHTLVDVEGETINWHPQSARLLPLSVMGDGNCLFHAASMAMWGVQDRERVLRRRVASLLHEEPRLQYRWRQHFARRNRADGFTVDVEQQWVDEWQNELELIDQPDASLGEVHVFALACLLRRPIIVYAERVARDGSGNPIAPVHLAGLYLPLLHGATETSPLTLLYHGNHFMPLVVISSAAHITVPICDKNLEMLPVQFASDCEMSRLQSLVTLHLRPEALVGSAEGVEVRPGGSGQLGRLLKAYGACIESAFAGEVSKLQEEKAQRTLEMQEAASLALARKLQQEENQRNSMFPIFAY